MKNRITELREERGISGRQLALKAGISPAYLSRLEKGVRKEPTHDVMLRISAALDVRATELFGIDLPVPATADEALMASVAGHIYDAVAEHKVKPSGKIIGTWIAFVYNNTVTQHLSFAQRRELANTIVKVSKKDTKAEPLATGEMPKKARKTKAKRA